MTQGKIPGPYVGDVKKDEALMEYVPFENMDIGARKAGMPQSASTGPKRIDHVGGTDGTKGKEGKNR